MNLELKDKIGGRSVSSPLTPVGEQQATLLGEKLISLLSEDELARARFFTSSAVRAKDTCRNVMGKLGKDLSECIVTDELLELDMGDWEGAHRQETYNPSTLEEIRKDVIRFKPPGGESQLEVEERMLKFVYEEIINPVKHERQSLNIVFGHGLATKCLLRGIMEFPPHMTRKIVLENTSITEIIYTPEEYAKNHDQVGWQIVRLNDHSHLSVP